jgi:DNA-binding transcriptional ArsR family regulator
MAGPSAATRTAGGVLPLTWPGKPVVSVPKSTLSNHWRILREAGLTATVRDGRHRRMSLRRDDLEVRFPGLLAVVLKDAWSTQALPALPALWAHPGSAPSRPVFYYL